jgi:hypothetical protein
MSGTIFSVRSNVDLGITEYYLNEDGYHHMLLGHRDLKNIIIMGIEETIKNPTHIYRSKYDVKRYQFVSYNVVTQKGHPMNVIVEMERPLARVITASPKNSISGMIVWDQTTGLYVSYDKNSDVLYISHEDARADYANDDEDPIIWFRFHEDDESPAGVTVFQAATMWAKQQPDLTNRISTFLHIQPQDVEQRIKALLG